MRMITPTRWLPALTLVLFAAAPAYAQTFAQVQQAPSQYPNDMFDSMEHNFGVVARGAEVMHRFKVTNKYKQDVRIVSVTTSCGCTSPKYDQSPIKSLESTYIEISMDTNKFQHEKKSTVTVTFEPYGVVQIPVQVYIRSDVVLSPGSINFGEVEQGTAPSRTLSVAYAFNQFNGIPTWSITGVKDAGPYLKAKAVQKPNTQNYDGTVINYDLEVALLPTAPVGKIRQEILLDTNDPVNRTIAVVVQAQVDADVTVAPQMVQLGSILPGTEMTKTVILHGAKPFSIEKVECESARQAFKMPPLNKDVKTTHVLSLTFTAPKQTGPFGEKFIVTIKDRRQPIVFNARGVIETAQQTAVPR
jgi:hypothetical protein